MRSFAVAVLACAGLCARAETPDFVKDVQPILEKSCYSCHGPKVQMGQLRLDSKALALKSIKPGHSGESTLYQRVAGTTDQARMPMGGKLTPEQVTTLKSWIDSGAEWPETATAKDASLKKHWAFVPPQRPAIPTVSDSKWPANDIDRFILAKLDKEQLKPSPEADRVTLLRRVSLDLIGLPPTIAEVDAFLKDTSPDAYAKQVDRLLASPHYGERWGRHWLDAARYADSDGYEKDKSRQVWFYRDWVINSLNKDLPYNQFLTDQLAGDLEPNHTQDQVVATGFLRNSMINEEGGVDPEQFRMEAMFDRMEAIGKGMLGITIQCAQCHNHKYDPLTQEEYYKLFAYLNNSYEANAAVYTPQDQMKRGEILRRTKEIEDDLQHRTSDWMARMTAWEKASAYKTQWSVVKPTVDDISNGGQKYVPMSDGSLLAQGYAPTKHKAKMSIESPVRRITAIQLELLNDPNLPLNGPGRSPKGTGALTEFEAEVVLPGAPDKPEKIKVVRASADINLPEAPLDPMFDDKSNRKRVTGPIDFAIDGKEETAWGIDAGPGLRNQPRKAVFFPEKPIELPEGAVLVVYLSQRHGGWNSDDNQSCNLGRMRLSVTGDEKPDMDPLPMRTREVLNTPAAKRSPDQVRAVFSYWRTTVPEFRDANETISALWKGYPEGSSQLVLTEREQRRPTSILTRGDFLKPTREVQPGTPAFLPAGPADAPANRLGLARWLTDRQAPTTARSLVNRVWQTYFGTGISSTSEDLGTQAEVPTHPELLDYLAVEFMDHGWSLKKLHRNIVTSATYRQSSKVTPDLLARDPYNRLLARGPRFRVEGEIVRDIALSASGLLNEKVGGPSVFPPAPEFLFQTPASYGPKNWYTEKGPERYRRALYTFRFRSVPYPMLQAYDTPNADTACVRRTRSNTPLQALTSLNEPMFLETARGLARVTIEQGGKSDDQRVTYAFRRCLSRLPSPEEKTELLSFVAKQRQRSAQGWLNAWEIAGYEPGSKLPADVTPSELTAWTALSRILLNLDETITKE